MGLVAWYPLNGDLEDYSGNGNNLIGTVTINNNGKIGKTYNFSRSYLTLENPIKTNVFSISVWVKYNNNIETQCIFSTRTTIGLGVSLFNIGNTFRFDAGGQWLVPNYEIPIDKWIHLTFVKDNNVKKIYIDGELHSTTSCSALESIFDKGSIGASQQSLGGYNNYLSGNLNDLRFYDEALSLKEIKEIAKAKILHYNFNQFVEPTENLYKIKSQISSSVVTPTWINDHTVRFSSAGGTSGIFFNDKTLVETNTYYTLSYNLKKISGVLKHIRGHINTSSGWEIIETKINGKLVDKYTLSNALQDSYQNYKIEVVLFSNNATTMYYSWIQPNYNDSTVVEVEISNIQLEKRKGSTPFTKNKRESQLITDSSGFKNHSQSLQLATTPQWTEDSVLGSGCYKFNGVSSIIEAPTHNFNEGAYSISLWFNKLDNLYYQGVFQISNPRLMRLMGFENNQMRFHPLGLNNGDKFLQFSYEINRWYNVIMIIDNTLSKLYVNGVKIGEVVLETTLQSFNGKDILLGRDGSDTSRIFNGYLDDIRIYATALSDEDIKELYQSRGSISKNGKTMVNEIIEVDISEQPHSSVNKRGQLIVKEIIEVPSVFKMYKNGTVSATEFIEN